MRPPSSCGRRPAAACAFWRCTDHDSVDAVKPAIEAARQLPPIEIVPGIEINTDEPGGEVHVLGYFLDHEAELAPRPAPRVPGGAGGAGAPHRGASGGARLPDRRRGGPGARRRGLRGSPACGPDHGPAGICRHGARGVRPIPRGGEAGLRAAPEGHGARGLPDHPPGERAGGRRPPGLPPGSRGDDPEPCRRRCPRWRRVLLRGALPRADGAAPGPLSRARPRADGGVRLPRAPGPGGRRSGSPPCPGRPGTHFAAAPGADPARTVKWFFTGQVRCVRSDPEGAGSHSSRAASTTNQADIRGLPGAEPHDRGSSGAASV